MFIFVVFAKTKNKEIILTVDKANVNEINIKEIKLSR